MTVALLLVFIVPFSLAVGTIVGHSDQIVGWAKGLAVYSLPAPPDWVGKLPVVGTKLNETWRDFAAAGSEGLRARLAPHTGVILKWFAEQAGSVGMMFVQFLLTVVIAAVLYAGGETAAGAVRRFFFRLAGQRGEEMAILAAKTIRGVALGVVLTALVQSLIGRDRFLGDGRAVTGTVGGSHIYPRPGATALLPGHGAGGDLAVWEGGSGLGDRASRVDDRCQRR